MRSISKKIPENFYHYALAESCRGLFLFPETDDFQKIRTMTVLF
jgi:hypothetical protein